MIHPTLAENLTGAEIAQLENRLTHKEWISATVGKIEVGIMRSENRGYIEHEIHGEQGGLWFNSDKELIDYDGVCQLSKNTIAAIRQLGYIVTPDFE